MAPYVPDEINVYSVPHSRMKELVNSYFTLVGSDYSFCVSVMETTRLLFMSFFF